MDDEREGSGGMGKVELLTRASHESWFRMMKLKLQAKEAYFTVEKTEEQFAQVVGMADPTKKDEDEKKKPVWDDTLRSLYIRKQALALWMFAVSLSSDDVSLIDTHITAKGVWDALKEKYQKISPATSQGYTLKIASFNASKYDSIDTAWQKIKDLQRLLIAANPSYKLS